MSRSRTSVGLRQWKVKPFAGRGQSPRAGRGRIRNSYRLVPDIDAGPFGPKYTKIFTMGKQGSFSSLQFFILFLVIVSTAKDAIGPRVTETDNRFDFRSVQYFVSKGATSSEIIVHFTHG